MLVAVVSDTHRNRCGINKVIDKIQKADVLIHLGDNTSDVEDISEKFKGKILNVKGNCDFSSRVSSELIEEIAGKRFFITHGHNYGVKNGIWRLQYRAEEVEADIVLYGHTHISEINCENGVWYINPGSASEARNGAESFGLIEISERGIYPTIVRL